MTDTIVLHLTEDAYNGDAQCVIAIDGAEKGTFTITAPHGGPTQDLSFSVLSAATHYIAVNFTNDLYGGDASHDRNLYVDGITVNGVLTNLEIEQGSNGARVYAINTPINTPVSTASSSTGTTASAATSSTTSTASATSSNASSVSTASGAQSNQWEVAIYGNPQPSVYYFTVAAPRAGTIAALDTLITAASGPNLTATVSVMHNGVQSNVGGLTNKLINGNSSIATQRIAAVNNNSFAAGDQVLVSFAGVVGTFSTVVMHLEVVM